jgi:hypothetical protein
MSDKRSDPPSLAIWLLQHARPGTDNEALTGDLIERFREGRSRGWFWKQVLIAIAVGILSEIRRHWPHFSYAIAGTAMPHFLWETVGGVPGFLHWSVLPWPWSQLVFELSRPVLLALAALPVLACALLINAAFRWVSLLRTGMISLALITLGHYLLGVLDTFPWLLRPVPGNPHLFRILLLPPASLELMFFSSFLVSAWLGCRSRQSNSESDSMVIDRA